MKRMMTLILLGFFIILIVLPSLIVRGCDFKQPDLTALQITKKEKTILKKRTKSSKKIKVYRTDLKKIVEMDLEIYLQGVIAAEMPAGFEREALMAQAVAARTYTLQKIGSSKQAISTDFQKSQAWISEAERKERWGAFFAANHAKIKAAVEGTRGLVLTYQGQLIQAYYHSTCGGKTEFAKEVFSKDYPYLKSVSCAWDQRSPRYQEKKEYTQQALKNTLGIDRIAAIKVLANTAGGRIAKIKMGEKIFTGTELRRLLSLRSTRFSWRIEGDRIIFHTIGNGHGVGMCQFGSDGLAKHGRTFQSILKHYYPGTKLEQIKN